MSPSTGSDLHVVLGHGQIGRLLAARLAGQGHRVRVVTRTRPRDLPAGVEHRPADLTRSDDAVGACQGGATIYHVAGAPYARWSAALPAMLDAVSVAAAICGAHVVYLDNLYAFGAPARPITEDTPREPVEAKGRLRHELAERLLRTAQRGTVPGVAVAHSADFFGPGVTMAVAQALVFDAVAAGKTPRWPVSADQPHAMAYTPDVAAALAALGTRPAARAGGPQRWIIPTDDAPTGRQLAGMVAAAAGRPDARVATLSPFALRLAGLVNADAGALARLTHQYDRPFTVDGTRMRADLGVVPTPIRQAVAATVGDVPDRVR
jgi:nucleoside-diphosphate-sugar epimerase